MSIFYFCHNVLKPSHTRDVDNILSMSLLIRMYADKGCVRFVYSPPKHVTAIDLKHDK